MNITVYTTPTCPWCSKLREWLKKHKIEFKEFDVSIDLESAREMIEKSGQTSVPVTLIDDQVVVGFNPDKLKKLLNIKE